MNRSIEIQFGEELPVEIQPVTLRKEGRDAGLQRSFWVGWQLFGEPEN